MLNYQEIENLIKDTFSEESDKTRVRFRWYENRFQLEFVSELYKENFAEFLNIEKDIDLSGANLRGKLDEKYLDKFLEDKINFQRVIELNEQWKNKPENFIELLNNYRSNGAVDENQSKQLLNLAKTINNDSSRYIYEIIQNADDCIYGDKIAGITIDLRDLSKKNQMKITYNEEGMTYKDIMAITTVGKSNKKNNRKLIGEKGIGFKTIFSACRSVDIYSGGYSFKLSDENFVPILIEKKEIEGTMLILNFDKKETEENKKKILDIDKNIYNKLKEKYGLENKKEAFKNCPILFTQNIKTITVLSESESFAISLIENEDTIEYKVFKDEEILEDFKIEYFKFRKDVIFEYSEYNSRYPDQYSKDDYENLKEYEEGRKIITYPIEVVFAKDESIENGNLYTYLPTYTNIKAPFNIQMPIKLNIDRSSVWFVGDSDTDFDMNEENDNESIEMLEWNKRVFDEMFFSKNALIKEAYEELAKNSEVDIFKYIPKFKEKNHLLFEEAASSVVSNNGIKRLNSYCSKKKLIDEFKNIRYFKKLNSINSMEEPIYLNMNEGVMFDKFIMDINYTQYYSLLGTDEIIDKDKLLLVYNESAIKYASCLQFEVFNFDNDDKKLEYLSKILKGHEEIVLGECMKEEKRSIYLPSEITKLKIFPSKYTNGSKVYKELENNIWFEKFGELSSNHKICFLYNEIQYTGLVKEVKDVFMNLNNESEFWNKISGKLENKNLFIEIMTLFAREENSNENWFEMAIDILKENKGNKFLKQNDFKKFINEKIDDFIGEK